MSQKINIDKCFLKFMDTNSPKIIGNLNDQLVMLVRCEGDKVPWPIHDREDEMFFVLDGVLDSNIGDITLKKGEFYTVRRGFEYRVVPQGHVKLLRFEPRYIAHTGDVISAITKKI